MKYDQDGVFRGFCFITFESKATMDAEVKGKTSEIASLNNTISDLKSDIAAVDNGSRPKLGVDGVHTSIAADVEIVTVLSCNHAKVLSLSLCAFADAAGHSGLHLVRRSDTLVAVLDLDRKRNGVLDAVAAPSAANARLYSS